MRYVIGFISEDDLLGRTWVASSMSESKQVLRHIAEENQDIQLTEGLIERFEYECTQKTSFGVYFVDGLEVWAPAEPYEPVEHVKDESE